MESFLDEIRATLDCGIYSTALASALIVPDAAGAVDQPRAPGAKHPGNRQRYVAWYNRWVACPALLTGKLIDGDFAWIVRNGMMHETALDFSNYDLDRVVFGTPDPGFRSDMEFLKNHGPKRETAIILDLNLFISRIEAGCRAWMKAIAGDSAKIERLGQLIQFRPQGQFPWGTNVPLVL